MYGSSARTVSNAAVPKPDPLSDGNRVPGDG
jgi:hypothetical protein